MKTTVVLDEQRLERLRQLAGLKTRRETIDFALREAERVLRLRRLVQTALTEKDLAQAIDPGYDLLALRELDKPRSR